MYHVKVTLSNGGTKEFAVTDGSAEDWAGAFRKAASHIHYNCSEIDNDSVEKIEALEYEEVGAKTI